VSSFQLSLMPPLQSHNPQLARNRLIRLLHCLHSPPWSIDPTGPDNERAAGMQAGKNWDRVIKSIARGLLVVFSGDIRVTVGWLCCIAPYQLCPEWCWATVIGEMREFYMHNVSSCQLCLLR
jgi:hypothetical protein